MWLKAKLTGKNHLVNATLAGKKDAICTLIIADGDLVKNRAIAGLGKDMCHRYGVLTLKSKLLNVREGAVSRVLSNAAIEDLTKALGLQLTEKYECAGDLENSAIVTQWAHYI